MPSLFRSGVNVWMEIYIYIYISSVIFSRGMQLLTGWCLSSNYCGLDLLKWILLIHRFYFLFHSEFSWCSFYPHSLWDLAETGCRIGIQICAEHLAQTYLKHFENWSWSLRRHMPNAGICFEEQNTFKRLLVAGDGAGDGLDKSIGSNSVKK